MTAVIGGWARRLPLPAAGLVALFSLYRMEGTSVAVPVWMALLALSVVIPYRLPDRTAAVWCARVPLIAFAILTNMARPVDVINMFDTRTMSWFGDLLGAELVLAAWVAARDKDRAGRPLWLSGLVMLAASSTPESASMAALTPLYFAALLIAIRAAAPMTELAAAGRASRPWRYATAVACVIVGGYAVSATLTAHRGAITL